jgi:PTH1 family peptidyl-tRNA hydrolase
MNLTGPAVEQVRQRIGVRRDRIVVVHDDVDLELGRVRSKGNGSDGGHKGLRSLFAALGNDGFMPRVRVGVRVPTEGPSAARSIVLQNFSDEDQPLIQAGLQSTVEAMQAAIASLK